MIVLPHEELEYQSLVEILDATREIKAKGKQGERKAYPLFPVVVFSRFIPPPPEPAADEAAEGEGEPAEEG